MDTVSKLHAAGAEVDALGLELDSECEKKRVKETSLHAACERDNVHMATLLIASGANVNAVRRRADLQAGSLILIQETAVHVALQAEHLAIVAVLITSRADITRSQLWGDAKYTVTELCSG